MKRTISLLLALIFVLALTPAVRADVIFEPQDSFYWEHRGECQYLSRTYYADGPDKVAVVYRSPESSAVVERVKNGDELWISYTYEDKNGISWGYCENYEEDWAGWVPMDYLLLKYDYICFQEEFGDRITTPEEYGVLSAEGDVYLWNYPGSEDSMIYTVDREYPPAYEAVFTDDAGRNWGYIGYDRGIRNVWVCLDDPTADYRTLYAENAPQTVTHPVKEQGTAPIEIKPAGPGMGTILSVVCVLAILSGGFLWITRKKK
jgi:hypothetical protein